MAKSIPASEVTNIYFMCEAGMGSSLMGANALKKKLKKAKVKGVRVTHKPAREVTEDMQVIVCHEGMAKGIRQRVPDAVVVSFKQFLNDPAFDKVVDAFKNNTEIVEG